jgi:hypothetical protein
MSAGSLAGMMARRTSVFSFLVLALGAFTALDGCGAGGVGAAVRPKEATARLLSGLKHGSAALCHVNVIPLNPTQKFSGQATTMERARAFQAILEQQGIPCTIRIRRGIDIQAGCGQLAGQVERSA